MNQLEGKRSFKISKWSPTTKFCPQCNCKNEGIKLSYRIFECQCGYKFDRDVHAAKNIKKFGQLKKTECLEQTSFEPKTSENLDKSKFVSLGVEEKTRRSHL